MSDYLLLPALLLGSWVISLVLYFQKRSMLRAVMAILYAAPFVVAVLQMFTLAPLFVPGDIYDHGMPGEFFQWPLSSHAGHSL